MPARDDIAREMMAQRVPVEYFDEAEPGHTRKLLRGVGSLINPERFAAAVEQMPLSQNIEDYQAGLRPPDATSKAIRSMFYGSRYSPLRSSPLARAAGLYDIR
jgi:hypothetical protein